MQTLSTSSIVLQVYCKLFICKKYQMYSQHDSSGTKEINFTFFYCKTASFSSILREAFWLHLFLEKGGNSLPASPP